MRQVRQVNIVTGRETTQPDRRVLRLSRRLDRLDRRLVILWRRRAAVSRLITAVRVDAGGTQLDLARERVLVHWYRHALGPDDGTDLALLVLRAGRGRLGEANGRRYR